MSRAHMCSVRVILTLMIPPVSIQDYNSNSSMLILPGSLTHLTGQTTHMWVGNELNAHQARKYYNSCDSEKE